MALALLLQIYVFCFPFALKKYFEHNANLFLIILYHKEFVPTGDAWFQVTYLCPDSSHWTSGIYPIHLNKGILISSACYSQWGGIGMPRTNLLLVTLHQPNCSLYENQGEETGLTLNLSTSKMCQVRQNESDLESVSFV